MESAPGPNFQRKLDLEALEVVRDRSLPGMVAYLALFVSTLIVTPFGARYPGIAASLAAAIFALGLFRILVVARPGLLPAALRSQEPVLFVGGFYAAATLWSGFACATLVLFELGWTSFFVLLVTLGLCSAKVPILAPRFKMLRNYLSLIFVPAMLVNLFFVGGLRGNALAAFFGCFFGLLLFQGRIQNRQYWRAATLNARITAMIDSLPGTVSWIDSGLCYLGANRQLADLLGTGSTALVGKPVGFAPGGGPLQEFARKLFGGRPLMRSEEVALEIKGDSRMFLLAGSRYNMDSEAVLLGLDVTEYRKTLRALEEQRVQARYTSKLAALGEITSNLVDEIEAPVRAIEAGIAKQGDLAEAKSGLARVLRTCRALHRFSVEDQNEPVRRIRVGDLIGDALALCSERFRQLGIRLEVDVSEDSSRVEVQIGQVLGVLLTLLNNAFDAVADVRDPWVRVELVESESACTVAVTDAGRGIPDHLRSKLFEPLFTTKAAGTGGGGGLSNAKEAVERNHAKLFLDAASERTRFILQFSKARS